ncbi:hypothetical protein C3942_12420 [Solimonas fluminis]|uniref:TonB-dependent receptor n=1 Tax=Solimonas fluminis TaxID=2086571 RepID=A0A2S5TF37_9GAMM|nr:TonB-dependent receptor [Solimonas fluminis]PPE73600.1 hypothetical protein C3942_12420 [Solimonas fluminis]
MTSNDKYARRLRPAAMGMFLAFGPWMASAQEPAAPAPDTPTIALPDAPAPVPVLAPATPRAVRLQPVVVTGTRTAHSLDESPVEVQLIDAEDIRRSGARDVAELLEREGGVYASRSAGRGSRIELQGLSSEHVLVLVDGRRLIGRINGAIDLSRLPTGDVERIEIVKGPSSALYGADALGGVINIITRRGGRDSGGAVTARIDEDRNLDLHGHAGWALGPVQGSSASGLSRLESYDLDAGTPSNDGGDGDSRFLSTNADWQIDEHASLGLSGSYTLDDGKRIDGGSANRYFDTHKRVEEVRVGAAPRYALDASTGISGDLYYNRYFDQFLQTSRADGSVSLDEETVDEIAVGTVQLEHRRGEHRLIGGLEAQFERLEADRLDHTGERDRQAVYAQDEWVPEWREGRLTVVPGLRYDRDSQFGDQFSPKLALRYALSDAWVLRAGYGRGYRAPDFKQLLLLFENPGVGYRVEGNPDLKPERSTGVNLGATWLAGDRASLSFGAYHNRVRDLIDVIQTEAGPPIVFSYRNVASATLTGLDAQARLRPWQPLELQLGYGWLRSRDDDTGDQLSGRPEHRANAALRYEQNDCALQLRGVWIGSRRFAVDLDTGGTPTPAGKAGSYALFDLRAEWLRWEQLDLAIGMDNLLDEGDPQYLPIAPRAAYLELTWNFR